MKILCVSDIVRPELQIEDAVDRFGPVDLLISCGDLPPEYLAFLRNTFGVPLLYIRGNHDIRYDNKALQGCLDVNGLLVRHGTLKIAGFSGSRWYNGGPNQYSEKEMRRAVQRLRVKSWWTGGLDIVVAHAPPRFIHDAEDLCHRGFRTFGSFIRKVQPAYFLHGHTHAQFDDDEQRITVVGKTRVINCCGCYELEIDEK